MRGRGLGGIYDSLTPEERLQLVLEAAARRDETEVERLAGTCPRYRYTTIRTDPVFTGRLRASRQIAFCVCLMLMELSAKLMVIRASREYVTLLSGALVTEVERGYLRGWRAGCDHAWQSAGMAGPFPQRADEEAGALADEDQDADGEDDDELESMAVSLATAIRTIWEAFARVCRAEMSAEPETVLLAWLPPMQDWIDGALSAADGARVDADVLFEYETALTDAWHEFMRDA